MQKSLGIVGGPSHRDAWLEVVLVPVIHWLSAVDWAGAIDDDRVDEIIALSRGGEALLKIGSKRHGGLHFKTLRLVHRALQAVTKSQCEGKVRTNLPGVL